MSGIVRCLWIQVHPTIPETTLSVSEVVFKGVFVALLQYKMLKNVNFQLKTTPIKDSKKEEKHDF